MDLNQLYSIVRRRWVSVVSVLALAVAVSAALSLSITPQYASTARVFVSTDVSGPSNVLAGSQYSAARVASYASLMESDELLRKVVAKLGSKLSPQALGDKVSTTVEEGTTIIDVTAKDPTPSEAKRIANVAAGELAAYVVSVEKPAGKGRAPVKATVQTASEDAPKVSPRLGLNLTVAALLGLLLGLAVALVRDRLDNTVKGREGLEGAVDAPVLGHLMLSSDVPSRPLLTQDAPNSPRSEAFRVIRSNLQFLDVDSPPRAVLITSALPGEGKTTVAMNLAISLAQTGQRVLLVECDLRRPTIAATLGLEPAVGLTSVLIGRGSLEECVQTDRASGIDVLTSGPIPPNPAELLQSEALTKLLEQMRSTYDMTVLDGPPLLPVADAAVLGRQVDSAILVVRHGKTTRSQVSAAGERLTAVGGRLLGVVLNMGPRRSSAGYGYGYSYDAAGASGATGDASGRGRSPDASGTGVHRLERRARNRFVQRFPRRDVVGGRRSSTASGPPES